MDSLLRRMVASPLLVRVAPFAVFVALTFCQGKFGETSRYWIYAAKTVAGAWLIWLVRPFISEMRWTFSWESVVVGVAVRSEEHTSELQSLTNLVCRLLLEKKN